MPLRRSGFSPDYAATTTRICTRNRSTGPHGPASAQSLRPPTTYLSQTSSPEYRQQALVPSIFGALKLGR